LDSKRVLVVTARSAPPAFSKVLTILFLKTLDKQPDNAKIIL